MVDPTLGYIITGTAFIVALLASVLDPFVVNGTLSMKIYIICTKNGVPYPIGRDDGHATYLSIEEAKERKGLIEEHDSGYCNVRGGLKIGTLEGSEELLRFAGFRW